MIVTPIFRHATIGECPKMTLLRFTFRSVGTLAIKLNDSNDKTKTLVALFDHPDAPQPCFGTLDYNIACVAYEPDWVIELIPSTLSGPGLRGCQEVPGVLYSSNDDLLIRLNFADSDNVSDANFVSLVTGEFAELSDKSVQFTSWQIWASENDRTRARGKPLFSFDHKE